MPAGSDRPQRAVVLLSGGLDSYTAAAMAKADGYELYALSVRYGQVHEREIEAARRVAAALQVKKHLELDVDLAAFGGSALVGDGEIPKDRALDDDHSIPSTYVPARNTVFLSLALAFAEVVGASAIVIGVNALDYSLPGLPSGISRRVRANGGARHTRWYRRSDADDPRAFGAPLEGGDHSPRLETWT